MNTNSLRFLFPLHGDVMVGAADGVWVNDSLQIIATVHADGAQCITVNGVPATKNADGTFSAAVLLDGRFNRLTAVNAATGEQQTISVYVFKKAYHTYRFTVDDFILAFQDLHAHRNDYATIFQNPYLQCFKKAHDLYGSKVHINAFYETRDGAFNLSMMTDRYREEFTANADWLTFSFHARNEMPDLPYAQSSGETIRQDCLLVTKELKRIVGEKAIRNTTTLHWGAATLDGTRALRALGYRALCGYLIRCKGEDYYTDWYKTGDPIVSYYLSGEQVEHAEHRCFWVDPKEDIIFAKIHMILNAGDLTCDRVEPFLDKLIEDPSASAFIQMVIHEQFFYPDYCAYEPDYCERILTMAKWMHEHGYKPVSLSEIIEETDTPVC